MRKLIFIILFMCSCSPAWHLQTAIRKGAVVKSDTVYQNLITERTITDTLVHFQQIKELLAGDTVVINTTRWRLKERIDTVTKTRYVQVECKPDTIRVIQAVNTEISAGYTKWELIGSTLGGILFVAIMAFGAYKLAGLVKSSSKSS